MPVKVGNSYVSEAAYEFAKSQADDSATLKSLAEKFPTLKFSVGTKPFSGNGLNNVAIAPNILREMENNPDKKLEYEALLYDVANLSPPPASMNVKSHGVIIDGNGEMSMWSIGESRSEKISVNRDTKSWWAKMLEKLHDKKSADAKNSAEVEISKEGLAALNADEKVTGNADEKVNGKVAFNAEKRVRQLAAATSKNKVREILNLLQKDLEECKDGVQNGMCDEDEVKKVEKMIERAEKRLNEVDDTEEKFSVDVLI